MCGAWVTVARKLGLVAEDNVARSCTLRSHTEYKRRQVNTYRYCLVEKLSSRGGSRIFLLCSFYSVPGIFCKKAEITGERLA